MTPQSQAEEFRAFLRDNPEGAPKNSSLVVHTTMDYFCEVMECPNARAVTLSGDEESVVVRSEW